MDTDTFDEWLERVDDRTSFDVDKAWHAVHFTLTADPWGQVGPFGAVVLGGQPFGEDLGYGPPRWLDPDAVADAARELAGLPMGEFRARLDFAAMSELDIYPSIWNRDSEDQQLVDYVVEAFVKIRDRFGEAAGRSHGFVISLL